MFFMDTVTIMSRSIITLRASLLQMLPFTINKEVGFFSFKFLNKGGQSYEVIKLEQFIYVFPIKVWWQFNFWQVNPPFNNEGQTGQGPSPSQSQNSQQQRGQSQQQLAGLQAGPGHQQQSALTPPASNMSSSGAFGLGPGEQRSWSTQQQHPPSPISGPGPGPPQNSSPAPQSPPPSQYPPPSPQHQSHQSPQHQQPHQSPQHQQPQQSPQHQVNVFFKILIKFINANCSLS